jgi:hypothetical protein
MYYLFIIMAVIVWVVGRELLIRIAWMRYARQRRIFDMHTAAVAEAIDNGREFSIRNQW